MSVAEPSQDFLMFRTKKTKNGRKEERKKGRNNRRTKERWEERKKRRKQLCFRASVKVYHDKHLFSCDDVVIF